MRLTRKLNTLGPAAAFASSIVSYAPLAAAQMTYPPCPTHTCVYVNTTAFEQNGKCSLSDAVETLAYKKNFNGCTYPPNGDTILLYSATFITNNDIHVGESNPDENAIYIVKGNGPQNTVLQTNGNGGAGLATDNGQVTIENLAISGVNLIQSAEGLWVRSPGGTTLQNVLIEGFNYSGIYNQGFILNIQNSTITNTSDASGLYDDVGSQTTVNTSTFTGNYGTQGGGIYEAGDMKMYYSTIVGNIAYSDTGGGVYIASGASWAGWHVTVAYNEATMATSCGVGGGVFASSTSVDWNSSIFSGNIDLNSNPDDYAGALHSSGNGSTGAAADIVTSFLCPLGGWNFKTGDGYQIYDITNVTATSIFGSNTLSTNNNAPTQTLALASGSPAIDAARLMPGHYGSNDGNILTVPIWAKGTWKGSNMYDQAGQTAPRGARYDLGSFEFQH